MTKHRRDPFRLVTKAELVDTDQGRWWHLDLECGHDDIRIVRYKTVKFGWGGYRRKVLRPVEDVAPPNVKVRCEACGDG